MPIFPRILILFSVLVWSGLSTEAQAAQSKVMRRGTWVYSPALEKAGEIGANPSGERVSVTITNPFRSQGASESWVIKDLVPEVDFIEGQSCGETYEFKKGLNFIGPDQGLYEIQAVFPNGRIQVLRQTTSLPGAMKEEPNRFDTGVVGLDFVREIEQECKRFCPGERVAYPPDGQLRNPYFTGIRVSHLLPYVVHKTFCGGAVTLTNPQYKNIPPALVLEKALMVFDSKVSPSAMGNIPSSGQN